VAKFKYFLIIFLILPTMLGAVKYPYPYYPLPEYSAAATFGTLSTLINPAALRVNSEIEMMYMHSFNSETFGGDNALLLSRGGLGFAYQNYRLSVDEAISAYTLAFSSRVSPGFYFGSSYTFMKSEDGNPYHNDHFWDMGLLARFSRATSFALVINNLRRMEFAGDDTEIEYKISLGIRPLQERLTVSADWNWAESEALADGHFKGYAALKVREGLGIYGAVDDDWNFGFGLNFSFGANQMGTYHSYSDKGKYRSGLLYSGYSYRPQGWLLPVKKKFLKLRLSGFYPETQSKKFFWQGKKDTYPELIRTLNRALEDESVAGLYIELEHPHLGWAQIQELRDLFLTFRTSGKQVCVYLGNLSGNGSYYLASCADRIAMRRVDDLFLTGLLAEITFYKGALDALGVKADLVHSGNYKSASDLLTCDSMSVYHREAADKLLDDFYDQFTRDIAAGRELLLDSLLTIIDRGPHVSQEALDYGLVDDILYPDEIDAWLEDQFGDCSSQTYHAYQDREPYRERWGQLPQIAVIPVEGTIMRGKSGNDWLFGKTIGSDDLAGAIEHARRNGRIKAVILRLNTPGGDGLEADLLRRELSLLREEKPLVISMSNVAASAGYHLASGGDFIYAQPSTVTGSIGVIYGKLDLSGLREKVGFNTYHLKRGKNADFLSYNTGFSDAQRTKMQQQIDLMYSDFVGNVAEDRGLSYEYVDSIAQGRVWSGIEAENLRLVDEIGGFWDAVLKARQLSGLAEEEVELIAFPQREIQLLEVWRGLAVGVKSIKSLMIGEDVYAHEDGGIDPPGFYYILPFQMKIY
jgi:protease-4